MQTQQAKFMVWLQAILASEKPRAVLRELMQQYELPIIEIDANRRPLRSGRTRPRIANRVKSAAT